MNKKITLRKSTDIDAYLEDLRDSAEEAQMKLAEISDYAAPLEFLYRIKFETIGCDPFSSQRPLNLIEQVNQTFTYLASFKAAKLLFTWHPGLIDLKLNLGTSSGTDIESDYDGGISAEVFAATSPASNDKLKKDIEKVSKSHARHKYVFFMCPNCDEGQYLKCKAPTGIRVWSLGNEYYSPNTTFQPTGR
jgi:predicted RNA-binding Zn-ribbon protein involved in translation (DUF1610 family)